MWTSVEKTRRKTIDTTRKQKHRQDQKDGHRYYRGNRRQVIDKIQPMERVRRPTHSTVNVPTEDIRPETLNNNQPTRLYLDARRRTTFTVQPLHNVRVDQECLRRSESSLPSLYTHRHITKTKSGNLNSTVFFHPSFRAGIPERVMEIGGAYDTRATTTTTVFWTI